MGGWYGHGGRTWSMWRGSGMRGKQFKGRKRQELEAGHSMAKSSNLFAIAPRFPWYFWLPRNSAESGKVVWSTRFIERSSRI